MKMLPSHYSSLFIVSGGRERLVKVRVSQSVSLGVSVSLSLPLLPLLLSLPPLVHI